MYRYMLFAREILIRCNWGQLNPFTTALKYINKTVYFRLLCKYKCIVLRHETTPKVYILAFKDHLKCHILYKVDLALMKCTFPMGL